MSIPRSPISLLPLRAALFLIIAFVFLLPGCADPAARSPAGSPATVRGQSDGSSSQTSYASADDFLIVDCHLPPDVHQLGDYITYLAARQVIRTTPPDCRAKGGEYVGRGKEALRLWENVAAESGGLEPKDQTYLGELHEQQGNYAKAAYWYEQAANRGYAPAKINLGQLYETGRGVEKDMVKALNLYREASGLGAALTFGGADVGELVEEIQTLDSRIAPSTTAPAAGGPTVNIIFPPIEVTSRTREALPVVKTEAGEPSDIWGRVIAPAGIRSLKAAGQEAAPDKNGLFHVEVPVGSTDLPVEVVAVDKQGNKASVRFVLSPTAKDQEALRVGARLDFGNYYAVIIGNNDYRDLPGLDTAVNDARSVDDLLRARYGFKTQRLENATRREILSAINGMRQKLTANDNLLIYYAGHGELIKDRQIDFLKGYWLAIDAEPNNFGTWISNDDIIDQISLMQAKHVIVVADSCYSGTMTRQALARLKKGLTDDQELRGLRELADKRARTVMTSGSLEPVVDSAGGKHSVFAKHFLNILANNDGILEGQGVFEQLFELVKKDTADMGVSQTPQYAPIRYAGHESADFLFVPADRRVAGMLFRTGSIAALFAGQGPR